MSSETGRTHARSARSLSFFSKTPSSNNLYRSRWSRIWASEDQVGDSEHGLFRRREGIPARIVLRRKPPHFVSHGYLEHALPRWPWTWRARRPRSRIRVSWKSTTGRPLHAPAAPALSGFTESAGKSYAQDLAAPPASFRGSEPARPDPKP